MSTPENQKGTKNPITLKIKFKSASIDQFIERYSVDVSRGGIFIRTKEPLAVGTPLRFEFQLQDGTALIGGDGTVVWNRAPDPNRQNVVPGMGVRFDKLTPDSQRVLERILADKEKLGTTQMESRFDAGVRAAMGNAAEPTTSQETPKGGIFGEEPTRAMSADQVNKLAEASQRGGIEEDLPTRNIAPSDLSDEVRKLAGGGEASGSLPAIPTPSIPIGQGQKLEPMRSPVGGPMVRSTLIGQGFGLSAAPTPSLPIGSINPNLPGPQPSIELLRPEPSNPAMRSAKIEAVAAAPLESAVTPVKPAETAARVAESQRTPAGQAEQGLSRPSEPSSKPNSMPSIGSGKVEALPPEPMQSAPTPVVPAPLPSKPDSAAEALKPAISSPGIQSNGLPKGLLIGAALLILIVAAAGYFVFVAQKTPPAENKTPPTEQLQPPPPPPPPQLPTLQNIPDRAGTDGAKSTSDATSGADAKGANGAKFGAAGQMVGGEMEVITDPPGAQVELAGKAIGVSPIKLPGLVAGRTYELKVSMRGYQEVHQKLKAGEDNKPIKLTLLAIERQLEILSTPKGADVYIDGKKVGRTPWIVRKVDLGKATNVEVRRVGFETWSHNVSDAEAFVLRNEKEVLTLNAVLEPASGKKSPKAKKGEEGAESLNKAATPESAKQAEPAKAEAAAAKQAEPAKSEEAAKPASP